jgi:hypothetical protein
LNKLKNEKVKKVGRPLYYSSHLITLSLCLRNLWPTPSFPFPPREFPLPSKLTPHLSLRGFLHAPLVAHLSSYVATPLNSAAVILSTPYVSPNSRPFPLITALTPILHAPLTYVAHPHITLTALSSIKLQPKSTLPFSPYRCHISLIRSLQSIHNSSLSSPNFHFLGYLRRGRPSQVFSWSFGESKPCAIL